MPSSKALLSSLSLAKVRQEDSSAHDVVTHRARKSALVRDQQSHAPQTTSNNILSPYQRRLTTTSQAGQLVKAVSGPASISGQQGSGQNSAYIKVPPLVLPRNDSLPSTDTLGSARLAQGGGAAHMPLRGALTQRGPPSSNYQSSGSHSIHSTRGNLGAPAGNTSMRQIQQASTPRSQAGQDQQQDAAAAAAAAAAVQQRSSSRSSCSTDASESGGAWESGYITPAKALKRYSEYLTPFEQSEILDYHQVYFVGRSGAQKIHGSPHSTKANCGYDDERGDYTIVPHDHLAYRYEVLGVLGKGSFGQVVRVHDFKTNTLRAVKVIRNKKRFHHQALVELKVLQHIKAHDPDDAHHVIHIQDHFVFRNHLCISFELLSVNLFEFVKQNNFMGLSLGLIRRFAHQILGTLKYLKELHIIHCDLKPENILLRQPNRSLVKVIDFGSSCFNNERVYTYIQSRFYRSPEVILGVPYGCEIDIWSFGAILAELYTGYPLFPGEDEAEQLSCMMEVLGEPPPELLSQASRRKLFFDSSGAPRSHTNSQGKTRYPGGRSLVSVLKGADQGFVDFLRCCLHWDPQARITPDAALKHPWITGDLMPVVAVTPRGAAQGGLSPASYRLLPLGAGSTGTTSTTSNAATQQQQAGGSGVVVAPLVPVQATAHVLPSGGAAVTASVRGLPTKSQPVTLQPLALGGAVPALNTSQLMSPGQQQGAAGGQMQLGGGGGGGGGQQAQASRHLHAKQLGPAVKPLNLSSLVLQPLSPASNTPKAPLTPRNHRGPPDPPATQQTSPHTPTAPTGTPPASTNGLKRLRSSSKGALDSLLGRGGDEGGRGIASAASTRVAVAAALQGGDLAWYTQ